MNYPCHVKRLFHFSCAQLSGIMPA